MMHTSLTRAASGAAVAAVAALAPAAANAATVHHKTHTTLSIVASRNHIKAGHKDVVSGTLRAGRTRLGKEAVILERVAGRKLVPVKVELTGRAGTVRFTVRPQHTTEYLLLFEGTTHLARTHSGVVTIRVTG